MDEVALRCHPGITPGPMRSITVGVQRTVDGRLELVFSARGDLTGVRVPDPCPPGIGDRLWEHTCFEVFIAVASGGAYHEFNFSPSGAWAAHAFSAYRAGGPLDDPWLAPEITVRRDGDELRLAATVHLDRLSSAHARASLLVGLSAVVEGGDGGLSYWALHHPGDRPDFHHPDALVLRVEPPRSGC